jgi:hypothetical protein
MRTSKLGDGGLLVGNMSRRPADKTGLPATGCLVLAKHKDIGALRYGRSCAREFGDNLGQPTARLRSLARKRSALDAVSSSRKPAAGIEDG